MKKIIKSKIFCIALIVLSVTVLVMDFAVGIFYEQNTGAINKIRFNQVRQFAADETGERIAIRSTTPGGQSVICELDTNEKRIIVVDKLREYAHRSEAVDCVYGKEGQLYTLEMNMDVLDMTAQFTEELCRYDNGKRTVIVDGLPVVRSGLIYEDGELYVFMVDTEDSSKTSFLKIDEKNHQYEDAGMLISDNQDIMSIVKRRQNYFVIYDDGSLGLLHADGEIEKLYEADTSISNCNSIFNVAYVGDELYAIGGLGGKKLYRFNQGKIEEVCDLFALEMQISPNTTNYVTMKNSYSFAEFRGNIIVGIGDYICFLDANGKLLEKIDSMRLPAKEVAYNIGLILRRVISLLLLLLGIFLLFANIFKWRFTLLARNLLIFPLIVLSLVGVTYFLSYAMNEINEDRQVETLSFASAYIRKILDADLIESIDDYSDIYGVKGTKLKASIDELLADLPGVYNYDFSLLKKIDDNRYALLYNAEKEDLSLIQITVSIPYSTMREYGDIFYAKYNMVNVLLNKSLVAVRRIINDQGQEVGVIVFKYAENASYNSTSAWIYMLIVTPFLILILVFVIMTNRYVLRNIRKVSTAVSNISQGDYENKIKVIAKDELGDICVGVNNMAQQIQKVQDAIITGMSTMVENRDSNTGGHIKRTSLVVRTFANTLLEHADELGIDAHYIYNVAKAAPMHDMGKIAVEDAILRKPGKFTDDEYEKMKFHASEGATIVSKILEDVDDQDFVNIAINVAHYHHEKWNGTGYPDRIQGEDIPLEARIMALADVFDALVSKRCYKDSMDYDRAFGIIEGDLGTHFDPKLGVLFLSCRPQLEILYNGIEH